MRISDWSSDVCSSDLAARHGFVRACRGRLSGDAPVAQGPSDAIPAPGLRGGRRAELRPDCGGEERDAGEAGRRGAGDRKSVGEGKGVSVRVDLSGGRRIKKKKRSKTRTIARKK